MEPDELARNFPLDPSQPELGMIVHPLAVQALERALSRLLKHKGSQVAVPVSKQEACVIASASDRTITRAECWLVVGISRQGEAVYALMYSTEPDGHREVLKRFSSELEHLL
ncbi:hypothetical protein SAMN04488523_105322 [Sulfitobacter brevis]|uniref:Uncharacterized protein n=1 Tax=Sulfitobacter brevis TaxID=74348 RepID=A0A1I1YSN4_9RHOB|nr:hypothetical protein [Sulfitobacter brevis]SFE20990.1 hypothetical protein SAMN04488523_105322 [Sulfitobacter brevis]